MIDGTLKKSQDIIAMNEMQIAVKFSFSVVVVFHTNKFTIVSIYVTIIHIYVIIVLGIFFGRAEKIRRYLRTQTTKPPNA